MKTFEIKGYKYGDNEFNALIPDTVTEIFFTDEIKPENASIIDIDADGDGGVVAWTENGGTVMRVSTQIKGMKVQAAKDSVCMFSGRTKLTNIDFSMLDTANVTDMSEMFHGCSSLTSLDLTPLNTAKVTSMKSMFYSCSGLTSLDLTSFNTAKVTNMSSMFYDCSGLTTIKTGVTFKFARTDYFLSGTWRNVIGETFNGDYGTANFPSNVADTYTKVS